MSDVRLVGTNPEDSSLVPVAVNSAGLLKTEVPVIEKISNDVDIEGALAVTGEITSSGATVNGDLTVTGTINGDTGGGGVELPPDPQDGQVLGWENGQLAWVNLGIDFELDYLVIAGGGNAANLARSAWAGGGAGGFISSVPGEFNPGNVPTPGPKTFSMAAYGGFVELEITAGRTGQNSRLAQTGWEFVAVAGGNGKTNKDGGSGGGASYWNESNPSLGVGGTPVPGQGFKGGDGGAMNDPQSTCYEETFECHSVCRDLNQGGGGGGAGGAGGKMHAGPGLSSSITGSVVTYCAGGPGAGLCAGYVGEQPQGAGNYGSGGGYNYAPQPGVVILRFPSVLNIEVASGSINSQITTVGDKKIFTATDGDCRVRITKQPGIVMSSFFDKLQSQ